MRIDNAAFCPDKLGTEIRANYFYANVCRFAIPFRSILWHTMLLDIKIIANMRTAPAVGRIKPGLQSVNSR